MRNLGKKNRLIIGKRTVRASRSTALRKRASVRASILTEYDDIRRQIGEDKYQKVMKFLDDHPEYDLSDVYYKESVWNQMEREQGIKASTGATRRYARPTMRSIRAARTETIQYLDFNELDERQKKQAVEKFMDSGTAYEWYSEDQMIWYEDEVRDLADGLANKTGIEVDTGKLYWQENSQGPYPEWNLNRAIDTYSGETRDGISYDIEFDGSLRVDAYVTMYDEEGNEIDYDKVPAEIEQKITAVQNFIDELWSYIHEICTSYPDEQWCYEMLEANNYEFRVDNAGNVVSMA